MGDDGRLQKMEVDYSTTVDQKLPEAEALAKANKLTEAVEMLCALEKQTRTASDAVSTSRVLVGIIKMCYTAKDWTSLNENIIQLTKRRGQLKQAVTGMVQEACTYVDQIQDMPIKLQLIDTLRTVSAGKIYVEIERAKLTKILSEIKEKKGDLAEAAKILMETQVETFGSMAKKDKTEYILEQIRLCLAIKDYIRAQIIAKKINLKAFDSEDTQGSRLKYCNLMIELAQHEGSYLAICKQYRAIYDTPSVQTNAEERNLALKNVIFYLLLAPHDNEQSDMMHHIKEDKNLEELPKYLELLNRFTTEEVANWGQVCKDFDEEVVNSQPGATIFNQKTDEGLKRWKDFKVRLVEHNMRVMAKYYTRVRMTRMAEILELTCDEAEEFLSNLVVKKTVQAKMDRMEGIVCFHGTKDPNDILNDWTSNTSQLMRLVNKATHDILKDTMIYSMKG